ncbi:AAA family ATPase [Corynebacterium urealyticum]|uniref:HelD family protein n=1 Tax=Corynebacterium urealyticum TaxID=43771 RepID=UPI0011EAA790|nr:AAA family ATPase [Corynebacterium urealyticum]TYT21606.1 AAA family ATPase [Corynebacterium urealyticum]
MTSPASSGTPNNADRSLAEAIASEQDHLDDLLTEVDATTATLKKRLASVRATADIDDPQGLMRRDREIHDISQRLDNLSIAEIGLMFGRIDVADEEPENPVPGSHDLDRRYIGRLGLHTRDDEMRTLLMDWRAPMARPFYLATTLHPDGVHLRRHIKTRGRKVTHVADERLTTRGEDQASLTEKTTAAAGGVAQEAALLDAVNAARSTRMGDIVETIAAEQDAIIRSEHRSVTVVQGAPGTGKTAVALHRAAYLLYTWREQLAKTGVLIVGPNARFLDYISQVLPSLGETGVVLATPGTLLPGVKTRPEPSLLAREVKGSAEMLHILKLAVQSWQQVPEEARGFMVDGVAVELNPKMVRAARTRARRSRKPHNQARPLFVDHAINSLADALAETIGRDPLGGENLLTAEDCASLRDDLREEPAVLAALDEFWPELTPEQVLADLYDRADEIASEYDEDTIRGLQATPPVELDGGQTLWTAADAPLLDELADMLGIVDDEAAEKAEREEWLAKIAEAQDALDILTGSATQDLDDGFAPEILMAYDVIDAEQLAGRQRVRDARSTAQRAAQDLRWAFGHVIVDEAQELSEMDWRMIFRRSPNRWMTVVGDPAQTGNPAGVASWGETLAPYVSDRWELKELSVNYRTPQDIADVANQLLPEIAADQEPAIALRGTGTGVAYAARTKLADALPEIARRAGEGLVGIIASDADLEWARGKVTAALGDALGSDLVGIDAEVLVVSTAEAKGLEFDEVVLIEPAAIVAASPQGLQDLYVAITRATQGLSVFADQPLPWDEG